MSSYYHYTLNFTLRRDTSQALIGAFEALTERRFPTKDMVSALPSLVQEYLLSGDNLGSGGFTARLSPAAMTFREQNPEDPAWQLHYERVFHDDEFWNGGMYLIYWLFQFAAEDGPLGTMQLLFDCPPEILTKVGDDIIRTKLAYNPEEHRPLSHRHEPLDADAPIVVSKSRRENLPEILEQIGFMADGFE